MQRLSLANAKFKHMRDAMEQKTLIASGERSVHGNIDWVWGYDPSVEWNTAPVIPSVELAS